MSSPDRDPLLDDLARLPPRPPLREVDDRVRARSAAAFEQRGSIDVQQIFARVGVPVVLAATAVTYLTWAVEAASALYR